MRVKENNEGQVFDLDGRSFETHWYENSVTGQRVEPKTIVQEYLQGR